MKAIIYARFSPRRNGDTCESNQQQAEACTRYAAEQGWGVPEPPYADEAMSGEDSARPGLWAAVDALRRGDVLLVWKFDRLARDGFLSYSIERAVRAAGASIVSASGEGTIDDAMPPEERLKVGILRLFAEYERAVIQARTSVAMQRHQREGRRMTRADMTPYGTMADPNNPARLIPHPQEQETIQRMKSLRNAGWKLVDIGKLLELEDCPPRSGNKWGHRTLAGILRREDYNTGNAG